MDKYLRKIYRNKKVLITGHTGFKGGWLSLWLKELDAKVIGYSLLPPTKPNLFEAINLKDEIIHILGDLRDEKNLFKTFEKFKPEFVFHLGAQSLVRESYNEPRYTYETNVMGTVNVLEAIRKTDSVRTCIIVTSDKCYENREWVYGYREIDPMGGYDPYSSSKGCAELAINAYRTSYFNPKNYGKTHNLTLSSARSGNVIGGGDWGKDRIMSDCIRALSKGKNIKIRNPSAIRPWQYILEPLSGYLLLGALMYKKGAKYSSAWNFGPIDDGIITVEQLVNLIIKEWGKGDYTLDISSKPYEANLLKLDISKARKLLGWKPLYDINEAVKRSVNWYKNFYNNLSKDEMYEITLKQIKDYTNLMSEKYGNKYN